MILINEARQNDMFDNLTPTAVTEVLTDSRYSRQERRHHAFVLRNVVNGKFVKREMANGKLIYRDVELKEATGFRWIAINSIISEMLNLNPTLDLMPMMAYRDKNKKICVK